MAVTLVTGLELALLLQIWIGTLCSLYDWTGIKSSNPYLKWENQFRSCDQGQEQKFRSKNHGSILYISISKINRTIVESYIIYVELYTSLESVKEFGKFGSSEEF